MARLMISSTKVVTTKPCRALLPVVGAACLGLWCISSTGAAVMAAPTVRRAAMDASSLPPVSQALGNRVSLNLKDIPISDVLRMLADQAHVNIVTTDGVTGNISIKLTDVSLETALQYIVQLKKLAYSVDEVNHTIVVGTPDQVRAYSYRAVGPVVVALTHATAGDIAGVVTKSFPGIQATAEGANQVVLTGSADDVESARNLIAALDVPTGPPAPGPVPTTQAVLNLQTSQAEQVAATLKALYPKLTTVSQGRQVILSGDPDDVHNAATLMSKIDSPPITSAAGSQTVTYLARYADVNELSRILKSQVPDLLVVIGPSAGFKGGGSSSSVSTSSVNTSAPAGGGADTSSAGGAAGGSGAAGGGAAGGGGASASGGSGASGGLAMRTDMLLLTGSPDALRAAQAVLDRVDIEPQQVMIEAKVVDVNLEAMQTIGINWNFMNFQVGEVASGAGAAANAIGASIFPFKTPGLARSLVNASLDLVSNNQHNKVLASPNIMALSDRPADIFIGDEIHYISNVSSSVTGQTITTATQNVGIDLNILSHVEPGGQITLDLHPNVSVLTSFVPGPNGAQLPLISRRSADTTMRVSNGQTVAIGGLIRDEDLTAINKVPFLSDLPFIGQIFKHRQTTHQRSEVIIFITATVQHPVQ